MQHDAPSDAETSAPSPPYTDSTAAALELAITKLAKSLPKEAVELAALLERGELHDVAAIVAVLEGADQ